MAGVFERDKILIAEQIVLQPTTLVALLEAALSQAEIEALTP